ncbi:cysteine-rich venom protein piscivorin [Cuculus canorus]|uniref:cysteine-rich venom protein piscivorin n=1 Tax=Cuculus canorus TaxID=55661 RepID=UPI0023AB0222|nr:cysteine-rich venom protein piscivorin [Cuculus canorus]
MILSVVFLCLAAVLPPSTGKEPEVIGTLSTSKADQQNLIVDKHNALRRGVNPTASNMMKMKWSPQAAKNAQMWVNKCTLSHSPANMRKTTVQCGENLFMSSAPFSWPDVVQAWYDEEKDFEYGIGAKTPGAVIGHFTQVVWHSSYEVGCAVAFCPNSRYKVFYVCQYCPAGNIVGSIPTPYKKGTPCGDCPSACDNGLCTKL